jgi:glutathione synthase/RimK-type ligase-like ATP-grasp enzyme
MNLLVVDNPETWSLHIPGVPVVSARTYLTDAHYSELRKATVFNLCRSYRYQSSGYYVSLLAMARGHRPLPSITTIQDMKTLSITRIVAGDLEDLIARSLRRIQSKRFTLSIYFGRNVARRYDELCGRLFGLFQAPLLRAEFEKEDDEWSLRTIRPIAAKHIPERHSPFVIEAATSFFQQKRFPTSRRSNAQYDLAILYNPDDEMQPSNKGAIRKFVAAARRLRINAELIDRDDFGRIAEFDALFIRETTQVHHHTYRFARRAAAEGLVVIDDPDSIAKCTNKVYLAELLSRRDIATPRTLVVHADTREGLADRVGLPCILKQPDSSFSQGVIKVDTREQLDVVVEQLLEKSDLIIAQEFVPTEFDWRIGVLDRQALYACRYHMAPQHWQIIKTEGRRTSYGNVEAVALDLVPRSVVRAAVRTSRLIGNGLYGVDVKQVGRRALIIEVNDNPNIDAGCEDQILGEELYDRIMRLFLERIQQKRNGGRTRS